MNFSHPNEEAITSETHSVKVKVVYPNGDSLILYQGPITKGPWKGTVKKSNMDLIISQFDSLGTELVSETYSYSFQNGTLKIQNKLELHPASVELVEGGNPIQINAKLFPSTLNLSITWESSDSTIAKITSEGILDPVSPGQTLIIASVGETLKDSVFVTVLSSSENPNPISLISGLKDTLVNIGDDVDFSVLAEGQNLQYKWFLNNIEQELATQSAFTLPSITANLNGAQISVEIYNGDTSILSSSILWVSDPAAPLAFLKFQADTVLVNGSSVLFSTIVNKLKTVGYSWTKDGTMLSDSSKFILSNVSELDAGQYILNVNWESETLSDSFYLTVSAPATYTISLLAGENGKITQAGNSVTTVTAAEGSSSTFNFEPDEGYVITQVLIDDVENASALEEAEYTFNDIDQNHSIEVLFGKAQYSLTISINPDLNAGSVNKTPDNTDYATNSVVSLKAVPNEGYQFKDWSGNSPEFSNSSDSLQVTIQDENIIGAANFERIPVTLTFFSSPGGSNNPGNPETNNSDFYWGDTINISANPNSEEGWQFTGWEVNVSSSTLITYVNGTTASSENANIVLTGENIELTANYSMEIFTITVNQGTGGGIYADGNLAQQTINVGYGSSKEFIFTADIGNSLSNVLIDGVSNAEAIANASYTFQNITQNHTISATFTLLQYGVNFDLDNKGARTGGGALVQNVNHGEAAVAPSVQGNVGWIFDGWDKSFNNVTSDLVVTATYLPETYSITVVAGTGGNVSPSGLRTVAHGSNLNISATPTSGYVFQNWTTSGLNITNSNSASTSITNVTFDGTATANFLKLWACGDPLVDDRPNLVQETYSTVAVGNQCWMGENLRAGTFLYSPSYTQDPSNNTVEKYCWNDEPAQCETDGGFYVWQELMANDSTPKSQGICPNGWHVPDTTEFRILINSAVDINLGGNGTFYIEGRSFGTGVPWYWLSDQQSGPAAPFAVSIREAGPQIEYWFSSLTAYYARCIKD